GAVRLGDQGQGHGEHLLAVEPAGQVDATGDIAPRVAAADLEGAVVAAVELGKIVGLQQGVGELGEGNALPLPLDALLDGLLLDHGVDGKVLAHVAEEIEDGEFPGPVQIVHHQGGSGTPVEVDELVHLAAQALGPACDHLGSVELALLGLEAGVANQPGGATHQGDGPVASELEAAQGEQRYEAAYVQAV